MRVSQFKAEDSVNKVVTLTGIVASKTCIPSQYGNRYEIVLQDGLSKEKLSAFKDNGYSKVEIGDLADMEVMARPPKTTGGPIYPNIVSVRKSNEDKSSFQNSVDMDKFKAGVEQFISMIESQKIRQLVKNLVSTDYLTSVGGVTMHHCYLNGLAQHIVTVCSYALNMINTYEWSSQHSNKVNKDIVIAGALLHDIGKVYEYDTNEDGVGSLTSDSATATHIVTGMRMLEREAIKLGIEFDDEDLKMINHIIASHHGDLAMGSPIAPATLEAMIVSQADVLDFRLNNYDINTIKMEKGEGKSVYQAGSKFNFYIPKPISEISESEVADFPEMPTIEYRESYDHSESAPVFYQEDDLDFNYDVEVPFNDNSND